MTKNTINYSEDSNTKDASDIKELSDNSITIPPEKAYFLQRTQVLFEVQQELLNWAKWKLWIISLVTVIGGFFGIQNIVSTNIAATMNPIIEKASAELKEASAQIIRAKIETEKSTELINKSVAIADDAEKKVSEFSKKIEELKSRAITVNEELLALKSQIEIVNDIAEIKAEDKDKEELIKKDVKLLQKIDETQIFALKSQEKDKQSVAVKPSESMPATQKVVKDKGISWKNVLGISWVKPSDIFGRAYFLEIEKGLYVWPVELDIKRNMANILVNTSNKLRNEDDSSLLIEWIGVEESKEFTYEGNTYRLNVIDIRREGKIPTYAVFLSVDKKQ